MYLHFISNCPFSNIVTGVRCSGNCSCRYNQALKVNVLSCRNPALATLLLTIPKFTDWIFISHLELSDFCLPYDHHHSVIGRISNLHIESSNITNICDDTLSSILSSPNLTEISLINNSLTDLSPMWKTDSLYLERLWLGGNPMHCHCDMLWMMSWIENATGASGQRLVQDYQDVICAMGPETGTPVYKLDKVKMKCYPKDMPIWIIIGASALSASALIIVITIVLLHRYRRLIRWLIYKNFDKLLGDPDRNEDVTDKQFDAFISFRYARL